MIITSISKIEDESINSIPEDKIFFVEDSQIYCKWFTEEEALELNDNEMVPGIKELIPKALDLYEFNE
jgi:hypothetical protein